MTDGSNSGGRLNGEGGPSPTPPISRKLSEEDSASAAPAPITSEFSNHTLSIHPPLGLSQRTHLWPIPFSSDKGSPWERWISGESRCLDLHGSDHFSMPAQAANCPTCRKWLFHSNSNYGVDGKGLSLHWDFYLPFKSQTHYYRIASLLESFIFIRRSASSLAPPNSDGFPLVSRGLGWRMVVAGTGLEVSGQPLPSPWAGVSLNSMVSLWTVDSD